MTQSKTIKRLLTAAVSAVMSFSALPLNAAGAEDENIILTYDDFEISYAVTNEWLGGQNVLITVTNLSDESICNWAFRYDAGGNIENLYNAEIFDNDGTEYIIKNEGWNFELAPKHSVSFGYSMYGDDFAVPSDFALCSERVDVTEGYDVEIDYTDMWYNGVRGEIAVTNTSEEPLEAWTLTFNTNFKIDYVWDGKITDEEGNHYAVASEAWTQYLAPGETKSVGFVGSFDPETEPEFSSYELIAVKIKGLEHSETAETEQENENTDPTEVPEIDLTPELNAEDIDMTTDIIDLGYIENLIDANLITVNCNENSQIRAIDGKFTEKPLNSAEDAANILNCASSLFGYKFCAEEADIEVQTDGDEMFYRYSAHVDGVLVQGSQIILSATDGEATGMFSTYDNIAETVNTKPSISSDDAVDISFDNFFAGCSSTVEEVISDSGLSEDEVIKILRSSFDVSSELMLTQSDNELVWDITIVNRNELTSDTEVDYSDVNDYAKYIFSFCTREYYIYAGEANAGSICTESDVMRYGWEPYNDSKGIFNVEKGIDGDTGYRMRDAVRNIETYETIHTDMKEYYPKEFEVVKGNICQSESYDFNGYSNAISVHCNMSKAYDFYKSVLLRSSFNGNDAPIRIYTGCEKGMKIDEDPVYGHGEQYKNACWNSELKIFLFGTSDEQIYENALDLVAHEYTHAVTGNIAGLNYTGQSGALDEAYADIMGNLIELWYKENPKENKDSKSSFETQAENTGKVDRNLKEPYKIKYTTLQGEEVKYPSTVSDMDEITISKNDDHGGVHLFSTVFSHTAYSIITDQYNKSITTETWAQLFYKSLYRLCSGANFQDARYAVISAAKEMGFTSDQQTFIKKKFDESGITEPYAIRIVLEWGENPSDLDSHLTGPKLKDTLNGNGRFHTWFMGMEYYVKNSVKRAIRYAAELDYDETGSYGPEVTTIHSLTPGDYYFYVHDYSNKNSTTSTEMSLSGVTVSIYYGSSNKLRKQVNGSNAVFSIPDETVATLWEVCKITIDEDIKKVDNPKDYDKYIHITAIGKYSNESEARNVGNNH